MKIAAKILSGCLIFSSLGVATAETVVTSKGTIINSEEMFNEIENTELNQLPETNAIKNLNKLADEILDSHLTDAQIEMLLQAAAKEQNKTLPENMGDGIIGTRVTAYKKTVVYNFDNHGTDLTLVPSNLIKDMLIKEQRMCETLGFMFKLGVTVVYKYKHDNGKILELKFTPKECGF